MKHIPSHVSTRPQRQRGIALVIVLAFLVLIAGLMIAFFSNVSTEFAAARSFADGITTKQLADSATNLVMGQIREATAVPGGAWASQAGMIRVYGAGNAGATPGAALQPSETLHSLYKLYSSEQLVLSGSELTAAAVNENFVNWWNQPAAFTDLNQPVKLTLAGSAPGNTPSYRYPIMDPSFAKAVAKDGIVLEGFDLTRDPRDNRNLPLEEKIARMPARWIYMLRDGTLTTGTPRGNTITWDTNTPANKRPTAANPVVGRIAYWTDDESAKVNINTAGGFSTKDLPPGFNETNFAGSFWDAPRAMTRFERGVFDGANGDLLPGNASLGLAQVVNGEFQRYPGHPSTTSLGLIFGNFLNSEQIYQITPRLNGGGSRGGTQRLLSATDEPLKRKNERLYASVDELLFANPPGANDARLLNADFLNPQPARSPVTPEILEKTRFFLTAHSRAPELNLQGRPRIALWPEHTNPDNRNASDRLIAFCSTVGGKPFYFQRENAYDPTFDGRIPRNAEVYDYLRGVTSLGVPGFGSTSFESKLGKADRDQILTEMFDYIRTVNMRDSTRDKKLNLLPQPKRTQEKEKFKFAPRGIVVPIQMTRDGNTTTGFGRFPTISEAALVLYHAGYVLNNGNDKDGKPTADYETLDYRDRFKTVKDASNKDIPVIWKANLVRAFLVFEIFNPMQGYAPTIAPDLTNSLEKRPTVIEVSGLSEFALNGTPMGFTAGKVSNAFTLTSANAWGGRNSGGSEGFTHLFLNKFAPAPGPNYYPFQSGLPAVKVPLDNPAEPGSSDFPLQKVSLSGAKLQVAIKFGADGQDILNFAMQFPAATVLVPTDDVWLHTEKGKLISPLAPDPGGLYRYDQNPGDPNSIYKKWACNNGTDAVPPNPKMDEAAKSLAGRLRPGIQNANFGQESRDLIDATNPGFNHSNRLRQITQPGDTVRSLLFGREDSTKDGGDIRVSLTTNGASVFRPHPDYNNPDVRHAQSLRMAGGSLYYQGYYGKFDAGNRLPNGNPGLTYTGDLAPKPGNLVKLPAGQLYPAAQSADLPGNINGVVRNDGQPGDFDTGIGNLPDGAFSGKADEGNLAWRYWDNNNQKWVYVHPYFTHIYEEAFDTFFTPNRQVPSAMLFGSLLRGRDKHWETLCFSPNPAGDNHPGNLGSLKDSLFLDLFHMPIVEPYAISEPFSTAGKVNMNYRIAPYSWIQRSTGIRAALHSVRVAAFPTDDYGVYKTGAWNKNYRLPLNRDETLKAFDALFAQFPSRLDSGLYKSAAQICERFLYPKVGVTGAPLATRWTADENQIRTFWKNHALTGDNLREKPYGDIYPRLTTKSNTYTVHMRVQTLRKAPGSNPLVWREGTDQVTAEYRGSNTIERYIDPNDRRFDKSHPDTVKNQDYIDVDKNSLEPAYHFRVVNTKRFLPY
jgi:uncharacterized protein (TIGR02600 family)